MVKRKSSLTLETSLLEKIDKLPGASLSAKIEQLLMEALELRSNAKPIIKSESIELQNQIAELKESLEEHQADIQELIDWKSEMPHFEGCEAEYVNQLPETVKELRTIIIGLQKQLNKLTEK